MSKKQQTAVEWLENEFQEMCKDFGGIHSDFIVKFDQAKEMEKQQIGKAFFEGRLKEIGSGVLFDMQPLIEIFDNYYNETYKND